MRLLLFILAIILSLNVRAQKKIKEETYYVFDKDWKPCAMDTATYLSYVQKFDDTTWQWNNYKLWGSLITVESYKDREANNPNGYFGYFNTKGYIDSCGNTINGLRDGKWLFFEDSLKPQLTKDYVMGKLVKEERHEKKEDIELKPGEKEANFPNGEAGWRRYLERNFKYPERAIGKEISGSVYIYFVVNAQGKIESPFISKSVEFSIDRESMRLMYTSPSWIPAEQDGRKVKAYRIQPITFALL